LLETVLKTFGLLGVESVVVEDELRVGVIFAEELTEVIFGFVAEVLFGEGEDELVEAILGDREEELVVFFDGNEIAGFADKFSQEASVLDSGDEGVDFVLLSQLSEQELAKVGDLDRLLLLNILKLLACYVFAHDLGPMNFVLRFQQLFCLDFLKRIITGILVALRVYRVV
jgi:hypothetical protein